VTKAILNTMKAAVKYPVGNPRAAPT